MFVSQRPGETVAKDARAILFLVGAVEHVFVDEALSREGTAELDHDVRFNIGRRGREIEHRPAGVRQQSLQRNVADRGRYHEAVQQPVVCDRR
jgi:hypothetical protein